MALLFCLLLYDVRRFNWRPFAVIGITAVGAALACYAVWYISKKQSEALLQKFREECEQKNRSQVQNIERVQEVLSQQLVQQQEEHQKQLSEQQEEHQKQMSEQQAHQQQQLQQVQQSIQSSTSELKLTIVSNINTFQSALTVLQTSTQHSREEMELVVGRLTVMDTVLSEIRQKLNTEDQNSAANETENEIVHETVKNIQEIVRTIEERVDIMPATIQDSITRVFTAINGDNNIDLTTMQQLIQDVQQEVRQTRLDIIDFMQSYTTLMSQVRVPDREKKI